MIDRRRTSSGGNRKSSSGGTARKKGQSTRKQAYRPMPWLRPTLFVVALLAVASFTVYTLVLLRTFREDARRVADLYAERILPRALAGSSGPELNLLFDLMKEMPISIIVTDENGHPTFWRGINMPDPLASDGVSDEDLARIRRLADEMDKTMDPQEVVVPLEGGAEMRWYIHVAETSFLRRVAWLPLFAMFATVMLFIAMFWGFTQIKQGEQQAVWVGLAKETAHQLGTPISSLSGWLEILHLDAEEHGDQQRRADQFLNEMNSDVDRLRRIANRFDQIGSEPELTHQFVTPVVDETLDYFRARLPTIGRDTHIERQYDSDDEIPLNQELLGWAFENIIKNALDAVSRDEPSPTITVSTKRETRYLTVSFKDNGKGLSSRDLRKIFQPGFTTKKRGWGLGLTFVKRIVEDYHGGRIEAHSAGVGKGTTIEIRLPVSDGTTRRGSAISGL